MIIGHPIFVLVRNLKFYKKNKIGITFYMTEENLDQIINIKHILPINLEIDLLNGFGKPNAKIILTNIRFVRHRIENMALDYTKSDILCLESILQFSKSSMKLVKDF